MEQQQNRDQSPPADEEAEYPQFDPNYRDERTPEEAVRQAAVRAELDFGKIAARRGKPVTPAEQKFMEEANKRGILHTV